MQTLPAQNPWRSKAHLLQAAMARIWDFSASFEPKMVANAMARFWYLDCT